MTNTNVKQLGPWLSIDEAAAILRVPVVTLRRAVERTARHGTSERHGTANGDSRPCVGTQGASLLVRPALRSAGAYRFHPARIIWRRTDAPLSYSSSAYRLASFSLSFR
jgi:hypothetical protein